jgi:multidrug efflux pump subunit AcrA (membrane-fusion protein)
MSRRPLLRAIPGFLAMLIFLCGCGSTLEEIPELIEPVSANASYRPVEYGDIGTISIESGTVVPTDYCHFFHTAASISSITVDIGDYVQEGDVLALADVESARSKLSELERQLELNNAIYEQQCDIYDDKISELGLKKQAFADTGDSTSAAAVEKEIQTEQENKSYDEQLHNYQIEKLDTQIDEQKELIQSGTLTARHAGFVTYVMDISESGEAAANQNVVVVSDEDDIYIELTGISLKAYAYADYPVKYAKINGTDYDVEEYGYTTDELIFAQTTGNFPYVRLKTKNTVQLTLGDVVPVYYCRNDRRNVLVVGNDSLNKEGDKSFVYVQGEDGELERRDVELGASDDNYTEVLGGVDEGELVYYSSDSTVPVNYDEYTATATDFVTSQTTTSYQIADSSYIITLADRDAVIDSIAVKEGDEVKKGDLLCTLDTGDGTAAVTEAAYAVKNEEESYQETVKGYDASITDLNNQIENVKNQTEPVATDTDAMQEYLQNHLYKEEQLKLEIDITAHQKEIARLQHEYDAKSLNDAYASVSSGSGGMINIYAEADGVISDIKKNAGDTIADGDEILSTGYRRNDKLLVKMVRYRDKGNTELKSAKLGQTITFTGDKTYTGRCIGTNGDDEKYYLTTIDGVVYETVSKAISDSVVQFYASVDDETFYTDMPETTVSFPDIHLSGVIVLPESMIYTEHDKAKNMDFSYVWKLENGQFVKQYVVIDTVFSDDAAAVILSGVKAGDVLATEALISDKEGQ